MLTGLYVLSCSIVPRIVDEKRNAIYGPEPFDRASDRARDLQSRLAIADLHADSLIWDRNLMRRNSRGQVDLPRLQQANIAVQIFSVPTKVPKKISGPGTRADPQHRPALCQRLSHHGTAASFRQ